MTLRWAIDRLRRMTAAEVGYRVGQRVRATFERIGLRLARPPEPLTGEGNAWLKPLPTEFDSAVYLLAAERILQGRVALLGIADVTVGFPPVWNRDPKTGTLVPRRFGKTLNYRNQRVVGEIRYLWELNRHRELLTLAQAWHLSGDQRYLVACRALLESWLEQCPYPLGPNWTSSLEAGIRLINWTFAWHLLGGEDGNFFPGAEGRALRRAWLDSVYEHCFFIAGHPSLHSSANNHLLGEQVGLFVAATTWPMWPEAQQWQQVAQLAIEREALLQIAPDGVLREQAVWYQHEVTDLLLTAGLVGQANGKEFSTVFWARIEAMLDFIASIMDRDGHVPAFGDADDAEVVGLRPAGQSDVYRSLLATGAVLFGRGDFKAKAVGFDDKSRWLLGDRAAHRFDSMEPEKSRLPPRRSFPEGGYFVLGSDFETTQEVRIVADAGPLGYLSIAAHGHADALSFTLSVAGEEILIDPGTYVYQGSPDWREYFRGTSAHNTLRVDDQSQSRTGGTFMWIEHAETVCETLDLKGDPQELVGRCSGFFRGAAPAVHKRRLSYSPESRCLKIRDELESTSNHKVEVFWHFSEQCEVIQSEDHALIRGRNATVALFWPELASVRMVRGQEDPPLAWISRRFDHKTPCTTIVVTHHSKGNWQGESEIRVMRAGEWCNEQRTQELEGGRVPSLVTSAARSSPVLSP